MGRESARGTQVFIDGRKLTGLAFFAEMGIDVDTPEVTAFEDGGKTFVEGKYTSEVSINAFGDLVENGFDSRAFAEIGADVLHLIGIYPGSAIVKGDPGYEIRGRPRTQPRRSPTDGAYGLDLSYQGDLAVVRANLLAVNDTITATGVLSGSNFQVGASTSPAVYVATLRVYDVVGSGSITVLVEESQNDGGGDAYATLFTFTAATAENTSERLTLTSSTEAWKRVNVSAYSGFTSVKIAVTIGPEQ